MSHNVIISARAFLCNYTVSQITRLFYKIFIDNGQVFTDSAKKAGFL